MHIRLGVVTSFLLLGCGGADATPDAFSPSSPDAFSPEVPDAGPSPDAASLADAPSSGGTSVAISYGEGEGVLDRAWLGYHRTGSADAPPDGLYFELSRGADDACPSMTSPVPAQIVTIDGFTGAELATRTDADGLEINFFDFEGTFFEEIRPMSPSAASVTVGALDLTAGTASGSVTLTFGAAGQATGTFAATHCDSLDAVD